MKLRKIICAVICAAAVLSCLAAGVWAADSDFVIEDGVLEKYKGEGGDIVIPEGVTRIYIDYFPMGEKITSISLPESLEAITSIPLHNCPNFTKYTVHPDNKHFSATDGILYNYDKTTIVSYPPGKTGEVFTVPNSVTVIGESAFCYNEHLTRINLGYKITEIGTGAFASCTKITSFDIPDSVTTMGQSVFNGCSSLSNVVLSENLTGLEGRVFGKCPSLINLTIPRSVSSINGESFRDSNNLSNLTVDPANETFIAKDNVIFTKDMKTLVAASHYLTGHYTVPEGVEYLGNDCLSWGNLESITLPSTLKSMGYEALCCIWNLDELTIPEGVTEMDHGALRSNRFESIVLPKSLKIIPTSLLYDCDELTSVTISPGTTVIGSHAFAYDKKLSEVVIPYSVNTIKSTAFIDCISLKEITLTDCVKTIEKDAFKGCDNLTIHCCKGSVAEKYAIDNGIKYKNIDKPEYIIEEGILYGYGGDNASFAIPSTVTEIAPNAFSGCTSLASVTIPDSVTVIGNSAFRDCTSLTSVTVPSSVTAIDDYAFWGCTSLSSVNIPDSVTFIGNRAFRDCTSLREITLPDSLTYIGGYIFANCPDITVHCNEGTYAWQYAVDNGLIPPPVTTTAETTPPVVTEPAVTTATEVTVITPEAETTEITEAATETTEILTTAPAEAVVHTSEITPVPDGEVKPDSIISDVLIAVLITGIAVLAGCAVLYVLDRRGIIELQKKNTPDTEESEETEEGSPVPGTEDGEESDDTEE